MNTGELAHGATARIETLPWRKVTLTTALRLREGTELATLLNPVMRTELSTLGALAMLSRRTRTKGLEPLIAALQTSHRENVRQLSTLLRVARATPRSVPPSTLWPRRLELFLVQLVSVTETLRLLRGFEEGLLESCRRLRLELDGPARLAMGALIKRTEGNARILQAHIALRSGERSREAQRLPGPLSSLFAGLEARVCLRCLLNRPAERCEERLEAIGHRPEGPYLCAACHEEVRRELPDELRIRLDRMARGEAEGLVLARAAARPSWEQARGL